MSSSDVAKMGTQARQETIIQQAEFPLLNRPG